MFTSYFSVKYNSLRFQKIKNFQLLKPDDWRSPSGFPKCCFYQPFKGLFKSLVILRRPFLWAF